MKSLLRTAIVALVFGMPAMARAADYAPMDCAKASSAAERTICTDYALGQAEARMATLYGIAMSLVAMGQRGDIGDARKQWLKTREACSSNIGCLANVYTARIRQLNKVIDGIAANGPY